MADPVSSCSKPFHTLCERSHAKHCFLQTPAVHRNSQEPANEPPAKKQRLDDATSTEEASKEDRRADLRKRGIAPVKPEYVNEPALKCDCKL